MKMKFHFFIQMIAILTMIASVEGAPPADSPDYLTPPIVLQAKEVLPADLLKGFNYIIEERVQNDGLINTYQLTTAYGPLTVESTAELMNRIAELNAMSVMEEMDRKKVFGDAVLTGVKAPFQGVVALVKKPVETSQGIVKGTGKFLSNMGRSIVSDDPYQDNAFKVAVGYDAAKRAYAYELHINCYSSYEPVITMLGKISQASVAGGLAPRVAMSAVDSNVVTAMRIVGTSEGLRKLVRDNPPGELKKINAAKLEGMGIPQTLVDAFLDNFAYNPQEATLLVGELEQMKGVKGREQFVASAVLASEQARALLYRYMAQMMAAYHTNVAPVESIGRLAGTPFLKKKDGTAVVLLPLDYIFRTAQVEAKLNRLDDALMKAGGANGKELLLTGRVDESARQMLAASGWKVIETADAKLYKK